MNTDFDMNKILDTLKTFGISPEKLSSEKFDELVRVTSQISDPSEITPDITRKLMDIFNVKKSPPVVNNEKCNRNDKCKCGSGKKFKKCCLIIDIIQKNEEC